MRISVSRGAFTLIELMVAVFILSMLLIVATPTYKKMILKSRTEEAKAIVQAIVFAQERYREENGEYYPNSDEVKNEAEIAKALKIDLSKSNNFNYFINTKYNTGYNGLINEDGNFTIKVVLRDNSWGICTNTVLTNICKPNGTINRDSWVEEYNTGEDKHFLLFRYPTILNQTDDPSTVSSDGFIDEGISYEYLYED